MAADGDRQSNDFHDFGQDATQARAAFNNSLAWGLAEMQIHDCVVLPLSRKQTIRLQQQNSADRSVATRCWLVIASQLGRRLQNMRQAAGALA